MTNAYAGQEPYATAWQQGYDYGQANPSDSQPQAPDYSSWGYDAETTGYVTQVWQEGALAGREAGSGGSSSSSAGGGGGQSNADGTITLPSDISAELTNFTSYYPELTALVGAGDGDTYYQNVVGIERPTDDENVA